MPSEYFRGVEDLDGGRFIVYSTRPIPRHKDESLLSEALAEAMAADHFGVAQLRVDELLFTLDGATWAVQV